jgi:hypothetical protein
MKRNYKVRYALAGFDKGAVISDADLPAGTNTEALIASQILTVDSIEPVACPACVEQEMKRPPKFETVEALRDHYREKHAGLVPPSEEDLADG